NKRHFVFLINSRYSLDGSDSKLQINHSHLPGPFMIFFNVRLSCRDQTRLPRPQPDKDTRNQSHRRLAVAKFTAKSMMTIPKCVCSVWPPRLRQVTAHLPVSSNYYGGNPLSSLSSIPPTCSIEGAGPARIDAILKQGTPMNILHANYSRVCKRTCVLAARYL
ncbi:hypothetical protein PpBr36_02370, partial [Pyricularia pennisetigena]|uniref:hypothetical protein n=1 Tax=Pyricularia pennisetigena TaxID=1578925 RepID=UPI00115124AC